MFAPGSFVGPSVFVSGSSGLFKQVKGWRRFHDRGRLGAVSSDLAAAEPHEREKGTRRPRTQEEPEDPGKDRPIDPTSGKNTPA